MSDDLRLRATVDDKASGPLRDIGRAVRQVAQAGSIAPLQREFSGLHGVLSTVGREVRAITVPALAALGLTGAGVVASISGVSRAISGLADKTLDLRNLARETGFASGQIKAFGAAAEHFRISPEASAQGLRNFSRNIGDLRLNLGGVRDELMRHGAGDVVAALRRSRSSYEALATVVDRMQKISRANPEAGRRFAETMFGDPAFARMNIDEIKKRLGEFGNISAAEAKAAEDYADNINSLSRSFSALQRTVGNELMPVLSPMIRELNTFFETNKGEVGAKLRETLEAVAKAVRSVDWDNVGKGMERVAGAMSTIGNVIGWIGRNLTLTGWLSKWLESGGAVPSAQGGATSSNPLADELSGRIGTKEQQIAAIEKKLETDAGNVKLRQRRDDLAREVEVIRDSLRKLREEFEKSGDAVKKMNFTGGGFGGGIMQASLRGGGGFGGSGFGGGGGGFSGGGGRPAVPPGFSSPMGSAGAGAGAAASGGGDSPAPPGGSEFLKNLRSKQAEEIKNTPGLRDQINGMLMLEGAKDPIPVAESLLNRHEYVNRERAKRGQPPVSLQHMLRNGFYGPINRGQLPGAISRLQRDPRLSGRMSGALDAALGGSNIIKGFTDQGLPSDPNGWRQPQIKRGGNVFPDWAGGPGGADAARRFREWQQGKITERPLPPASSSLAMLDAARSSASDANRSTMDRALSRMSGGNIGSAALTIDVNAPRGTKVGAESGGIFKNLTINRSVQMAPAAEGPAEAAAR